MFTDKTEGKNAAEKNRQILLILILVAKSLINLTHDWEAPILLSRAKKKRIVSKNKL